MPLAWRTGPQKPPWWRTVLILVMGMALGGVLVGVAALSGRLPTARAPIGDAPTPLSSTVFVVVEMRGDTLACVDPKNQPMLIHTLTATTFEREGISVSDTDVSVGARIHVDGKVARDGSVFANSIAILDPALSGTITDITDGSLSLVRGGKTITVLLESDTRVLDAKSRQPLDPSSLRTDEAITVYGTMNAGGQFEALIVLV